LTSECKREKAGSCGDACEVKETFQGNFGSEIREHLEFSAQPNALVARKMAFSANLSLQAETKTTSASYDCVEIEDLRDFWQDGGSGSDAYPPGDRECPRFLKTDLAEDIQGVEEGKLHGHYWLTTIIWPPSLAGGFRLNFSSIHKWSKVLQGCQLSKRDAGGGEMGMESFPTGADDFIPTTDCPNEEGSGLLRVEIEEGADSIEGTRDLTWSCPEEGFSGKTKITWTYKNVK
jgi:hypothetical protein